MTTALRSEEGEGPHGRDCAEAQSIASRSVSPRVCRVANRRDAKSEKSASAQRAMARLSRSRTAAQAGSSGGRSIAIQS